MGIQAFVTLLSPGSKVCPPHPAPQQCCKSWCVCLLSRDTGLYIFRVFESVNVKTSRFSSCKGLLRVCELLQHEILSKVNFHIYFLFNRNLEYFFVY